MYQHLYLCHHKRLIFSLGILLTPYLLVLQWVCNYFTLTQRYSAIASAVLRGICTLPNANAVAMGNREETQPKTSIFNIASASLHAKNGVSVITSWEKTQSETRPHEEWSLRYHISYYKVIWNKRQDTSVIRIYLRHVLDRVCLSLQSNSRCALRKRVTDLIAGWDHCDTNRRRAYKVIWDTL